MSLPLIGAALATASLDRWLPWIREHDRDLELQAFTTADVLEGDWRALATATRERLGDYKGRLGIHGPFWGFSLASPDRDIRALVARRLDQGLQVCEALGATQMVIHSPFTIWGHYHNHMRTGMIAQVHAQFQDTLATALPRAEELGVTLVLENIEDLSPRDRREMVQEIGSPALKLSVDCGHAHFAHSTHGAPPVDYYLRDADSLLDHVHLQDIDGHADRHWSLGEGTIAWAEAFRTLARLPGRPRLILELADQSQIGDSMRFLTEQGLAQ